MFQYSVRSIDSRAETWEDEHASCRVDHIIIFAFCLCPLQSLALFLSSQIQKSYHFFGAFFVIVFKNNNNDVKTFKAAVHFVYGGQISHPHRLN